MTSGRRATSAARSLFLQPHGGLAFEPPTRPAEPSFDEYVSDPAHPVEYIDQIAIRMTGDYMIQDQRVASRRPDVLVYESDALADDVTHRRADPGHGCSSRPPEPTRTGSSS